MVAEMALMMVVNLVGKKVLHSVAKRAAVKVESTVCRMVE